MNAKNLALATSFRHYLHIYPESSNNEINTLKAIKNFILEHTDFKVCDEGKFIFVDYKNNGNEEYLAFRADIDALCMDESLDIPHASKNKGISHKCGHDGHTATLLAFMLEVNEKKPKKNILFIFQPAEETGDGAKICARLFDKFKVKEIFGYHNMSNFGFKKVGLLYDIAHLGSYGVEIELIGKQSHASEPQNGINPVYTFAYIIQNLNHIMQDAIYSVVNLDVGQNAYGISAGHGYLRLTIRSDKNEILENSKKNLEDFVNKEAKKANLKVNFTYHDYFPVTINHKKSVEKIEKAAQNLGLEVVRLKEPYKASEDFGVYTLKIPGAIFFLGNGEDYPSIHTSNYDFRDELIEIGADLYMEIL